MAPEGSDILPPPGRPVEEYHLAAAIRYAAYVVVRYGDVYAPIFDRLETEMVEKRRRRSPADRARLALAAYTVDGGMKAIR